MRSVDAVTKKSLTGTWVCVFKLLIHFQTQVTRLLLNVNVGVRLLVLMGLAACVALLLAADWLRPGTVCARFTKTACGQCSN